MRTATSRLLKNFLAGENDVEKSLRLKLTRSPLPHLGGNYDLLDSDVKPRKLLRLGNALKPGEFVDVENDLAGWIARACRSLNSAEAWAARIAKERARLPKPKAQE